MEKFPSEAYFLTRAIHVAIVSLLFGTATPASLLHSNRLNRALTMSLCVVDVNPCQYAGDSD
jgi:hypothetical protein